MDQKIDNHLKGCNLQGDYVGDNQINNYYISVLQDSEREFVATHNANIKPVAYFTGRETEFQELRQRIEAGRKSVLVSGMGGIGKTHICRKLFEEYLNKHAEYENGPFRYIGYIEYNGDMGSSLQNCLKFKRQDSPEQNQEAAWRELEYLSADGKLLLFVDNVDKPISADPGLQRFNARPGAIVLTSRQVSFGDEFESYRIGFLSMEHCKEIYRKIRFEDSGRKNTPEEVEDLEYIIENLAGRHTITVELLAHLARTKLWSVKKLKEELEQKGFRLAFHKGVELLNIQESYEKLYDLSGLTEAERNILEAFSVFPYIPLAAERCNEWLLTDAGISEDDDILKGLYQKGWLQFDIEQESYSMHPVFAQFIYEKCRQGGEKHAGCIKACKRYLEIPENGSPLECQQYIPFAENIIKKMKFGDGLEEAEIREVLAYTLQYIAEYERAKELYKQAIVIKERLLGEWHPNTGASYNDLARVYMGQGEYGKAERLYEKVLAIREKALGEEHPDTGASYNNLANVYMSQGKYGQAMRLYEKGLMISKKALGEECLSTASAYNNLAHVHEKQGEYGKAEELNKKALAITAKLLGAEHLSVAVKYNNLARIYLSLGEYSKGEELNEKALAIRRKVLGDEHLDTATSYHNLAEVYVRQGKYRKAEMLYEKALAISEKVLGEEHPDTAISYNNLAYVYGSQGEYRKAEGMYKKALAISEKVLGEEHPDTTTSYSNLAYVYAHYGQYAKAEGIYKKVLMINEKVLGEKHPDTAISYNNLACVYESQGEYRKAEGMYEKALMINEKVLGEEHPDTATSYNNLAGLYVRQGKYGKAERLYEKALAINERMLGKTHPNTSISYNNLGDLDERRGKYEIAVNYYYMAYNAFLRREGTDHSHTKMAYKNMRRVYYEWNPKGDFEKWLEGKERIARG